MRNYQYLQHILIVERCCQSMSVSASEPTRSKQWTSMGKFLFYMMGSKDHPIYTNSIDSKIQNSNRQYLYHSRYGWMVS